MKDFSEMHVPPLKNIPTSLISLAYFSKYLMKKNNWTLEQLCSNIDKGVIKHSYFMEIMEDYAKRVKYFIEINKLPLERAAEVIRTDLAELKRLLYLVEDNEK